MGIEAGAEDEPTARDLTPEERAAMERATLILQEEFRILLADPARRASRSWAPPGPAAAPDLPA
jgi:hypothetical protein